MDILNTIDYHSYKQCWGRYFLKVTYHLLLQQQCNAFTVTYYFFYQVTSNITY